MHIKGKRSVSSRRWLDRQMNDPFVLKSKKEGYRARSAFKLLEIDEKYHILQNSRYAVDLGAAPGGWSQVISQKIDRKECGIKKIVSVDLLDFLPLPHVSQIKGDFSDLNVQKKILEYLGTKPDLIVSDMAPSTTGNRQIDHLKIMGLLDEVLLFVDNNLCQGGNFAAKIFQGGGEREYMELLKKKFQKALFFKPKSSRSESVEMFVVAIGKK